MKLYHVKRTDDYDYDDHVEFVCAAENDKEARETSPDEYHVFKDNDWHFLYHDGSTKKEPRSDWVSPMDFYTLLEVKEIGEALPSIPKGPIVTNTNWG